MYHSLQRTLLLLATTLFVLVLLSACSSGPEEAIADHISDLAGIMSDNTDDPKDGLIEMREYMHTNLPEIMRQVGVVMVELDECDSPEERQERFQEIIEAVRPAIEELMAASAGFNEAMENDEEAQAFAAEIMASYGEYENLLEGIGLD